MFFLAVLLAACGGSGESAFESDTAAVAETTKIKNSLARGGSVSAADLERLRALYEKYPGSSSLKNVLRDAYVTLEDWQSVRTMIEAVPPGERTPAEQLDLAKVLIKLGEYRPAAEILGKLTDVDQDERTILLARALFEAGEYEEAGKTLDSRWPSIQDSGNPDAIVARGLIHFHSKEYDKAVPALEAVLAKDPGSIAANNALSRIYSVKGDDDKASEYAQAVRESFRRITEESRSKSVIVSKLNRVREAYAAKDYATVISLCRELLPAVDPANRASLYQYLIVSYEALGMNREAEAVQRQAAGGGA